MFTGHKTGNGAVCEFVAGGVIAEPSVLGSGQEHGANGIHVVEWGVI
jgi:hypothetical protein